MKSTLFLIFCLPLAVFGQQIDAPVQKRIITAIDSSNANNMVLQQSFTVNVPLDSVWNAYTTKKGWESWVAAQADVDFKINGTIRTNYNKNGEIGDSTTITLHVVNFVPYRMLTLQAELNNNFPEFMQEDEKNLFNTVLFERIGPQETKIISYGIGYKNNAKYWSLMKFFIQGNEQSYLNLIAYLETGLPSVHY